MMKKKLTVGHIFIVGVLVILSLLCLYPMWYTLVCSFSTREYVDTAQVWFWPKGFNLTSYEKILEDSTFFSTFFVSVKRAIVGCVWGFFTMVLTAYPLSIPRKKFPAGRYIKWFFIANMLFSGGLIPYYALVRQYGLFDSFWVLILPGVSLGNIILMINFFRGLPYELVESATMDGANPFQILFKIYVPLSRASVACLMLFTFVGHWNSYFDGLMYINDVNKQPLQTYMYQLSIKIDYQTMSSDEIMTALQTSSRTLQSAKVVVAMIPIICVYPFIQKYFTTGLTLGAVKG